MTDDAFMHSGALWNRSILDLASDETLAQIVDRGDMTAWRALFAMARNDVTLRERIVRIVLTVPTPLPYFWLAALASLGHPIDLRIQVPRYDEGSI